MAVTGIKIIWLTIVLAGSVYLQYRWKKTNIPEHLLDHPIRVHQDFVNEQMAEELLNMVKKVKSFPTNANDLTHLNRTYEHIGEAEPILANGSCRSSFLIPSKDRKECVLPSRFDIAYHFMKYGGIDGLKEKYEMLATRMLTFGRYIFDLDDYKIMKDVFTSPKFLKDAVEVCPPNKQVLDPFQYHLIIQIPGQTIPIHLDAPYFTDASRFQYPVWLLVIMVASDLYRDNFIDQIQVVMNLHTWNSTKKGGQFAYYPKNDIRPTYVQPFPRSATIVDGAKTIHAATLYKQKNTPPILPKSADNVLEYVGNDSWTLFSNKNPLRSYKTKDLRITVVYRARCFESEAKKEAYKKWFTTAEKHEVRPVQEILNELKTELSKRKNIPVSDLDGISAVELAIMFVEEFIRYPLPGKAMIPYNYCVLDTMFPFLKQFLSFIC
ncbi:hypothetical protein FO519_002473 [Halicephalobus sp. NKZ332]|nr:hypothetical protein FO519_002473 [Halicephalobus sp. NKZ332]